MLLLGHIKYLVIFVSVGAVSWFNFKYSKPQVSSLQPNEIELYSLLKDLGYRNVSPEIEEAIAIPLRDRVSASKLGHQFSFLNIHYDSAGIPALATEFDISHRFRLTIKKRGFLQILLGIQEGEMAFLDDTLMIETTHPYFIKTIYNNAKYQELLIKLLKTVDTMVFRNSSHMTVAIKDPRQMVVTSELMIEFVELIQTFVSHGIPEKIRVEPISYEDLNVISPTCVICFARMDKSSDFFYFKCCQSVTHTKHGRNWLAERNLCPYCKIEQPPVLQRETL